MLSFPALTNKSTVYLDNASTTQVPQQVLDAVLAYEQGGRGNPQRGLYTWAAEATEKLASARAKVASFIGAKPEQLLFTKGTTEGLNLLARALGKNLGPDDEVVITIFEHHANLLPWRELANERGFELKYLPMSADGSVDLALAERVIGPKTKVVSTTHASNVLGTILPVVELAELAHKAGAWMLVDAAQTVARLPINLAELKCDALVFGAHKMYGPEGVGALYLADELKTQVSPLLYGGGMVEEVLDDSITYADDVRLFEAGSPNVGGAIGFASAVELLNDLGIDKIRQQELVLIEKLIKSLAEVPGVTIYSPEPKYGRVGVVSFTLEDVHSHDVAQILADQNIAVRAGYHCAAPLTRCLHPGGTVRVSFGVYNTEDDVKVLIDGLKEVSTTLKI